MKPLRRKLSAGYDFRRFAGRPGAEIHTAAIPPEVAIPLCSAWGAETVPVVKAGQTVRAGQIIATSDSAQANPVHASVSGTVKDTRQVQSLSGMVPAIVIASDGTREWEEMETAHGNWQEMSSEQIGEAIYASGAGGLDSRGIPTLHGNSPLDMSLVRDIIVSAVEADLFCLSIETLLSGEAFENFLTGVEILHKFLSHARVHIALGKKHKSLCGRIAAWSGRHSWATPYSVDTKYPQGLDRVLAATLLGAGAKENGIRPDPNTLVISVQTILHVYDAVVLGKPVIERTIALAGTGLATRGHVRLRIGSPVSAVVGTAALDDGRVRLIFDSVMTGQAVTDVSQPVRSDCTAIIGLKEGRDRTFMDFANPGFNRDSFTPTFLAGLPVFRKDCNTNIHGEPRACISCSFCEEVCPAGIIPHLLFKYVERGIIDDTLLNLRIFRCVDCNLCDYVCPSKLPLGSTIRTGKSQLIEQGYVSLPAAGATAAAPGPSKA